MDKKITINPLTGAVYATPDIYKYYNDTKYQNCTNREDSVGEDSTMAFIQRSMGDYIPVTFDTITADTIYRSPAKIAIIANGWCASATEGFIVTALQSKKVTFYGENTAGMCSYGDWILVGPPCLPIELSMPTKKEYYLNNADYESIGIEPQVKLDPKHEENWIKQVIEIIEK